MTNLSHYVSIRTINNVKAILKAATGSEVVFGTWTKNASQQSRVEVKDFWINHADGESSLNDCFAAVAAL